MWNFASNCFAGGGIRTKNEPVKLIGTATECSDDDISSNSSRDEGLECPICWESFNIVENVPYILWCGHTLCKNCILGLQLAIVKLPTLPVQLPFFISCPWCNCLSPRLIYKGNLKFPSKNFFLLWMVESRNGDRVKSHSSLCGDHHPPIWPSNDMMSLGTPSNRLSNRRDHRYVGYSESLGLNDEHSSVADYLNVERLQSFLRKCLVFFVQLMAKFPLVLIFLMIVLYAIPASATILALYVVITVLFAVPSFLILYFAYPSLDWLVKEIIT
ncbi:uncharacterized protein LOC124927211 [Impatiens glandulifera]|uniref:uncharacterized protein LOC124927211 n=1 Tax=Impatiens glandulifera TaxID=253017 RepID=UPI001FB1713E|nr:uncharacterized protein LOC124927211 [Impatiens glandulifera]